MRQHARVWLVATLMAVSAFPAAAGTVYSVFYDNRFGTIDSSTGAFTQISTLPIPQAAGIAWTNTLFAQSMQGELISINPDTGASAAVGNADLSTTSEVFGGGANGLFEIDSLSDLYSINPNTGAATLIGATGLPANYGGWDTSLSDDGTNLFFTEGGGGQIDELYEINTTTGIATDLGSTGVSGIAGSAIVSGYLDLFQYNAGTDYIYSAPLGTTDFQPATVLSVQIVDGGTTLGSGVDPGYSAASIPEMGSSVLLGLGLVAIGLLKRRRRSDKN